MHAGDVVRACSSRRVKGRSVHISMSIFSSASRVSDYFKRNGWWATIRRVGLAVQRVLFSSRMVLFYCDLSALESPAALPDFLSVERHRNQADLSPQDLQEITSFWNAELAHRRIKERF